ncbi:rubrerythrin [Bacteroidales bacterium]|nr:rubrerythrin [Bacteroidales bacterium]
MEKSVKGTETEKNLLKSFAGESQARNRYVMFAKEARKEGFEQIAAYFEETALDEQKHAQVFFGCLEGGPVEITATYPAGKVGTTSENLLAAAMGEQEEWEILYSHFADVAAKEGFPKIATKFRLVAKVEQRHEARYRKLLANIESHMVFKKADKKKWRCRVCGHVHDGEKALMHCPLCEHPQAFFEILAENY